MLESRVANILHIIFACSYRVYNFAFKTNIKQITGHPTHVAYASRKFQPNSIYYYLVIIFKRAFNYVSYVLFTTA